MWMCSQKHFINIHENSEYVRVQHMYICICMSHKHFINIHERKMVTKIGDAMQIMFSFLALCRLQKAELEGVGEQPVLPVDFH